MTAPVVVFAVGNPSRGDDAIGPVIAGRLERWLAEKGLAGQVEVIEDFQLNIEYALDLKGRELVLFIDAGDNTADPYFFRQIHASPEPSHSTHALEPPAVLQVYLQIEGHEPPPSFVLCVRGERFELGEELTPAATARIDSAMSLLEQLLGQPQPSFWSHLAKAG